LEKLNDDLSLDLILGEDHFALRLDVNAISFGDTPSSTSSSSVLISIF